MSVSLLAVGAWLKNRACLLVNETVYWSPLHGDLSDPAACAALEASVGELLAQADAAGIPVQAIAHDLHPDFFSTHLAVATAAARGIPAIGVQHHHAHLAAVVAVHGITEPVVGWALDGVGLGTDNKPWGGELLWLDAAAWERLGHLQPLALPGGDRAAREPWRMAASVLHALGRGHEIPPRFAARVGETVATSVQQMLAKGINTPLTTSAGRWFDAAAGALGLSIRQTDEAEAAIALETAAARALAEDPELPPLPGAVVQNGLVDLSGVVASLFDTTDRARAAAGFHLAFADALAEALIAAAHAHGIRHTVLGGGCFFNRILRQRLDAHLSSAGLTAWHAGRQGCGDAGLAIGQAWVAAQQLGYPPVTPLKEILPCA